MAAMLLSITTTHRPATDLGYLLAKHPDRMQSFTLPFGDAHVVYPEASEERCTASLILDLDPVALVRGRPGGGQNAAGPLAAYVNDRPYVASSFLSVAIRTVFGSALGGRTTARPDLVAAALPFTATFGPVRVRGGEAVVTRLFGPLGYGIAAAPVAGTDGAQHGLWTLTLAATVRLQALLSHIYVLIPVLDDDKHYWVAADEIEKLLRHGEGWLAGHPDRELITRRYLRRGPRYARQALDRLAELDAIAAGPPADPAPGEAMDLTIPGALDGAGPAADGPAPGAPAAADTEASGSAEGAGQAPPVEEPAKLNDLRHQAVLHALQESGAATVLDLGCGEGKLLRRLMKDKRFTKVTGADVSTATLAIAHERLNVDRLPERQRERLSLLQTALTYRDDRLRGYGAAAVVEVVEHVDPARLPAFERAVFGDARPGTVVLTTPNRDWNASVPALADGRLRHRDHRFEWTRAEFAAWTARVAAMHRYAVALHGIGEPHPEFGAPTQMAVFTCA